jgi:hypothetical protein
MVVVATTMLAAAGTRVVAVTPVVRVAFPALVMLCLMPPIPSLVFLAEMSGLIALMGAEITVVFAPEFPMILEAETVVVFASGFAPACEVEIVAVPG